jgi:hypothetical protein
MQDLSFQPMVFDVFLMLKDWIIRGGIIAWAWGWRPKTIYQLQSSNISCAHTQQMRFMGIKDFGLAIICKQEYLKWQCYRCAILFLHDFQKAQCSTCQTIGLLKMPSLCCSGHVTKDAWQHLYRRMSDHYLATYESLVSAGSI